LNYLFITYIPSFIHLDNFLRMVTLYHGGPIKKSFTSS